MKELNFIRHRNKWVITCKVLAVVCYFCILLEHKLHEDKDGSVFLVVYPYFDFSCVNENLYFLAFL